MSSADIVSLGTPEVLLSFRRLVLTIARWKLLNQQRFMIPPRLAVMERLKVSPTGDPGQADRRRTAWRTRYALLGGVALVAAAGLIVGVFGMGGATC